MEALGLSIGPIPHNFIVLTAVSLVVPSFKCMRLGYPVLRSFETWVPSFTWNTSSLLTLNHNTESSLEGVWDRVARSRRSTAPPGLHRLLRRLSARPPGVK